MKFSQSSASRSWIYCRSTLLSCEIENQVSSSFSNTLSYLLLFIIDNNITVKEEIEKIFTEVRGFKPVGLSIKQVRLAEHFKKRVISTD